MADLNKDVPKEVTQEDVQALTQATAKLTKTAEKLVPRVEQIERDKKLYLTFFSAVAMLVVVIAYAVFQNYLTNARLTDVVQESLCPVYGLVLGGYNPSTRPEGPARDEYNKTFQAMRDAYIPLECVGGLVPPRIES